MEKSANHLNQKLLARLTLAVSATAMMLATTAEAQQFAVDPAIERQVDPGEVVATDRDGRIVEGFRLFTEETFGGNGRTCASCHPVENNFTIDAAFIRKLPKSRSQEAGDPDTDAKQRTGPREPRRL
jgi:cytochrome c peroxidase